MTTVPCPRCSQPVELDQQICLHCTPPSPDMVESAESETGAEHIQQEEKQRKRTSRLIKASVATLALLFMAWFFRGPITTRLSVAWEEFQNEVEKTRQPSHWKKAPEPMTGIIAPTAAPPPSTVPQTQVQISSFIFLSGGPSMVQTPSVEAPNMLPAPLAPPPKVEAIAVAAPVPSLPNSATRRFYGVVYDLSSLKPIAGAELNFNIKDDPTISITVTDEHGHYQIDLHKDDLDKMMLVSSSIPKYRPGQIEDKDPPLRTRSLNARKQLIAETLDLDLEPVPLRYNPSAEIVELNLLVIPKEVN